MSKNKNDYDNNEATLDNEVSKSISSNYTGSQTKKEKQVKAPSAMLLIRNNKNQPVHIKVGRDELVFGPYEERFISKSVFDGAQFQKHKHKFAVREE